MFGRPGVQAKSGRPSDNSSLPGNLTGHSDHGAQIAAREIKEAEVNSTAVEIEALLYQERVTVTDWSAPTCVQGSASWENLASSDA